MQFQEAVEHVLKFEGGYVNDPKDPGGETQFGISKRSYPNLDIKALKKDDAKAIYHRDFWEEDLPDKLRLAFFDTAVNSGKVGAAKLLQRALELKQDGVLGPKTRAAAYAANPEELTANFLAKRLSSLEVLSSFERFGTGWQLRILRVAILS